jgi:hypothetical protein
MLARPKLSTKILLTGAIIGIAFPTLLLTWLPPQQKTDAYGMKRRARAMWWTWRGACGTTTGSR